MNGPPLDEPQTELQGLAEKANRARRLAAEMTDPAVRRCFLELALESEARIEDLRKHGK